MKKRVCSLFLAVVMLASLMAPLTTLAEEYTTLTFGEEVTVELSIGEAKWFQFTPDVTKMYTFCSSNEDGVDPIAALYDSSMNKVAESDDEDGSNFCITEELVAGETYYLEAYEYDMNNEGSYTLVVKVPLPTDFWFDDYYLTTFTGTEYTMGYGIYPEDVDDSLIWTSSDESVATVDENGKVTFLAGGEVDIMAETVNGITDSCVFTVKQVEGALTLDMEKAIAYTVGVEERVDTERHFTYTPEETGYYRFYSYDIVSDNQDTAIDPRIWVRDVTYNELGYNDDGGDDVNVSVDVAMTAGETYYFTVELYDSQATGSFKTMIKKLNTAESVSIDSDDLVMEQGGCFDIYVTYSPAGSWQEDYVVTSSDESVVSVEGKTICAVGGGEATITVTTDLGLTDSITVTVYGVDELELDTTYTLEGSAVDFGANKRYAFTPSVSGRYTITSHEVVGEDATVGVFLSTATEELRYNDTQSDAFRLTYELQADVTYYYDVKLSCFGDGSAVDFMVTKDDDTGITEAKVNTDYAIDITNPSDGAYFVFKPIETGVYAIFSSVEEGNEVDTKLYVYNDNWELFYSADDNGGNSQYRLEEEFVYGETYYLKSFLYSNDDVGSNTMRIEPCFTLIVRGDMDLNGELNMRDAMALYKALSQGKTLTEDEQTAADVDRNGTLNMRDVMALYKQISAGQ